MRKSRFTKAQTATILREADKSLVCRCQSRSQSMARAAPVASQCFCAASSISCGWYFSCMAECMASVRNGLNRGLYAH